MDLWGTNLRVDERKREINDDLDDLFDIWLLLFREGLMMFFGGGEMSEQQGETVDKYSPCR